MRRHAFTLVEMLVTLAVTSILVVVMMNVFISGSTLWQKNEERLDTFREARAAMQMMTRDFSALSAIPNLNLTDTDASDPSKPQFPILAFQNHPDTLAPDKVNQEIYGIVPARNPGRSGLCAVGYFCIWDDTKKAFVLRRQFTESNMTFTNLQAALSLTSPMTFSTAFATIYARPANNKNTAQQSVDDIATYVYGFQFDWEKTSPIPGQTPVHQPWPITFAREMPAWIEIRFKALGSNAARKLDLPGVTRDTWTDPTTSMYKNMIQPGEQEFVTRIKLSR